LHIPRYIYARRERNINIIHDKQYTFIYNRRVYTHGQGWSAFRSGRSLEAASQQIGPVLFLAGARLRRAECVRNRARARRPEPGQRHRRAGVPEHVRPHGAVYRFGLKINRRITFTETSMMMIIIGRERGTGQTEFALRAHRNKTTVILSRYNNSSSETIVRNNYNIRFSITDDIRFICNWNAFDLPRC